MLVAVYSILSTMRFASLFRKVQMNSLLAFSIVFLLSCTTVFAAQSELDTAKQSYNKHNYTQAIKEFEAIVRKNPSNADAHYYLALSYMNTRQTSKAKSEFEWVSKNGKEKAVVDYSRKAIASLSGTGVTSTARAGTGKPRVLDFGAVWCIPCKKLEPVFDRVAENYRGRVDFVHYDCDVGEGKVLADKYNIHLLPTVLFMTANGTIQSKRDGGNITADDLIQNTEALLR